MEKVVVVVVVEVSVQVREVEEGKVEVVVCSPLNVRDAVTQSHGP